jgi:hypothetical protein
VSAIVCFLAGPKGGYIAGGVIDVAGGLQVWRPKAGAREGVSHVFPARAGKRRSRTVLRVRRTAWPET